MVWMILYAPQAVRQRECEQHMKFASKKNGDHRQTKLCCNLTDGKALQIEELARCDRGVSLIARSMANMLAQWPTSHPLESHTVIYLF
jgi:hypothetical protein